MTDTREPTPMTWDRVRVAHRLVQMGLLLTLFWKFPAFLAYAYVYLQIEVVDPFFPAPLRSTEVLIAGYLATIASVITSFLATSRRWRQGCAILTFLGCTLLAVHQGSFSDMTFVVAWWTALWALWFAFHQDDTDQTLLLQKASLLGRLIISVVLLGGAVGKWTPEYWSGEVFYHVYFQKYPSLFFETVRGIFPADSLPTLSKWYSRTVVLSETAAGFGFWLLPPRWSAWIGILLLSSIALFSTLEVFAAVMGLIGLAAIGFVVPRTDHS